jgi:8-oxo-dGTP pyrophosphatase MutT (NUDIX family)
MPSPDEIEAALGRADIERLEAPPGRRGRAAVALALAGSPGELELAMIVRASRDTDPWSGQVALPGGGVDPGDSSPRHAAEREAREEVALDLGRSSFLGDVTELQLRRGASGPAGVLSAHAFYVGGEPIALTPEPGEVAQAFWFPLAELWNPARATRLEWSHEDIGELAFPAIDLGQDRILWGLTYRVLEVFSQTLDRKLPVLPGMDWPPL